MGSNATKTTPAPANTERGHQSRKLHHRGVPFLALLLMVPIAELVGGLLHFVLRHSTPGLALATGGLVAATYGLAHFAYHLGSIRRDLIRWHLVVTIAVFGLAEAVTTAIGLPAWWALTFLLGGEFLAGSWALHRIDALRHNPNQQPTEDPLTKKLGLENTKFGKPKVHTDAAGDVTRIEVPVKHGPGETAEVIQGAVPGLESVADQALGGGVPRGRSRAVPGEGAGTSTLTIVTKDVLKGRIPYPGPSAPGKCITEPLQTGLYEDQQPGLVYIAGGHEHAPNPSSRGWMGMTRTGKTMEAQISALEIFTRRHVAPPMWFDTIKGSQTVKPMRRGLDIIVASDDPRSFRAGMKALTNLVKWRANRLGDCGYRAWIPECALDPRLKMGLLYAHFEEADALTDIAADEMVFLASKGLSAGVVCGFSLQRADATSMPTGLRFNIGNWSVFGCGDEYSAGFALSDGTISAGAHPENWKQSKPGYHYAEGIGIPEERWPVVRKAFFATDAQMQAHTETWAPQLMPLDEGSIAALGNWYAKAKADTATLVARWDGEPAAQPEPTTATATPTTSPADPDDEDGDEETAELHQQHREDIETMRRDGTIEPQLDPEAEAIDPTQPVPQPAPDGLSWGDDKDTAPTREAALDAFERALREVADDPELADEDQPGTVVFQVGTLVDRYKFRSRPWFSEHLTALADGDLNFPGLILSRADKPGHYRLDRLADVVPLGSSA